MTDYDSLPNCFGTYEYKDDDCEACSLSKKCSPFTAFLQKEGKSASQYLVIDEKTSSPKSGSKIFEQFLGKLVQTPKKKLFNRDPDYDQRRNGPCAKARRASRRVKFAKAKHQRELLTDIFYEFKKDFEKGLKERTFSESNSIVSIGQFYVVDRAKSSKYIGIRCRTEKGADLALVVFKLKTSDMTFDVKFPFSISELKKLMAKSVFAKLKPVELKKEGQLVSVVKAANKFHVGLIMEFLLKIINDEKLKLS